MFNRRMLVALAACTILSASTAMAGGAGGTKKDSTIKVVNSTNTTAYVFVDVADTAIQAAAASNDPLKAFDKLGGKQVAAGNNSVEFKVLAGPHTVTAVDIVNQVAIGKQNVVTTKGKTSTVTFSASS